MKSKLLALSILAGLLAFVPAVTFAGIDGFDPCAPGQPAAGSDACPSGDPEQAILGNDGVLRNGLQVFVYIGGFASLVMITVGGFRYVLAGGDPQQAAGARNTLIYAVIGLVIALGAQSILTFVIDRV